MSVLNKLFLKLIDIDGQMLFPKSIDDYIGEENVVQVIDEYVKHPFGTIKRNWGAYYFLMKRKASVSVEISLSFLAYIQQLIY